MTMATAAAAADDGSFGPQLKGSFDFTLLFEQSIFAILPSSLLLCIAPLQVARLCRSPARVRPGWLLWSKIVCSCSAPKTPVYSMFGTAFVRFTFPSF
jgi:hypothetical protein